MLSAPTRVGHLVTSRRRRNSHACRRRLGPPQKAVIRSSRSAIPTRRSVTSTLRGVTLNRGSVTAATVVSAVDCRAWDRNSSSDTSAKTTRTIDAAARCMRNAARSARTVARVPNDGVLCADVGKQRQRWLRLGKRPGMVTLPRGSTGRGRPGRNHRRPSIEKTPAPRNTCGGKSALSAVGEWRPLHQPCRSSGCHAAAAVDTVRLTIILATARRKGVCVLACSRSGNGTPSFEGVERSAGKPERDRQSRRATREGGRTANAMVQPTASAGWRPAERWQSPRPHGLAVRWASPQPPQQRRRSPQPRGSSRVASAANASTASRRQRCVAAGRRVAAGRVLVGARSCEKGHTRMRRRCAVRRRTGAGQAEPARHAGGGNGAWPPDVVWPPGVSSLAHGRARKGTPECDGVAQSAVGRERDRQSRRATREGVSTAKAVVQPTASAGWRPAERWQSPRPHGLAVRWASPQPPQQRRRSPQPRGSSRVAPPVNASTAPRRQRCVAAGRRVAAGRVPVGAWSSEEGHTRMRRRCAVRRRTGAGQAEPARHAGGGEHSQSSGTAHGLGGLATRRTMAVPTATWVGRPQRRRSPQPRGSSRVASAANASTAPRGQRCVAAGKVQAQSQQVEGMGGRTAAQWQRVADAGKFHDLASVAARRRIVAARRRIVRIAGLLPRHRQSPCAEAQAVAALPQPQRRVAALGDSPPSLGLLLCTMGRRGKKPRAAGARPVASPPPATPADPPPPADRILVAPSDAKAAVTLLPPAAGHPPRGMETRAAARRRLAAQGGATGTTASARQAVPVGLPAPEPHNGGTAGAEAASSRAIAGGPTTRSASRRLVTAEAVEGLPSTVASCDGAAAPPLTAVTTGRRATRSTTRRGGAASSRGRGGAPSVAAADAHVERQGNGGGRSFQSLN
ncbi:hypothetical protein BU14_0014s0012 [Porphyra umbilicalis]|uniref:Uncharacterized protein n=1 Tax=Porphyra umbilicalis TaxID=2786 RepID=A0A1X6PL45_PORUM|nr:hypothetical protein BU14_0014s0012 [Porphyra umbilicalis]|eukprot:OSX81458.1 hypothetical protein BU14_0014s0012 [Porphyra umbilicalis]